MVEKRSPNRGKNQRTARAGEYYVAAELSRREAYAVTFTGNMPGVDILASNSTLTRTVKIQVKTRRSGTWQSSSDEEKLCKEPKNETSFWIFVDISHEEKYPEFWIVPDWWIRKNIYKEHHAFLKRHGGQRPSGSKSTHHNIDEKRITQWKNQWNILKICKYTSLLR